MRGRVVREGSSCADFLGVQVVAQFVTGHFAACGRFDCQHGFGGHLFIPVQPVPDVSLLFADAPS